MTEAAIADHALIGDLQTAALVSTDGSVDWFCCPRFDSPSVFGALIDDERGGHFRIRPASRDYSSTQVYFPDTAVLITRFVTPAGLGEVVDFMPPAGSTATANHQLVRMLRCVRGEMSFEIEIATVRLRPRLAPSGPDRARRGLQHRRGDADPALRARTRRRAAGAGPGRRGRYVGLDPPDGR
jgi:GH15 family glucan-1,4-alpha-glucosidase